jgi:hypothetical protein
MILILISRCSDTNLGSVKQQKTQSFEWAFESTDVFVRFVEFN